MTETGWQGALDHEGMSPLQMKGNNRTLIHFPIVKEGEGFEGISTSAGRTRVEKVEAVNRRERYRYKGECGLLQL